MNRGREIVDISGELIHETERAWLFTDGENRVWLPKSICEWDEQAGVMTVPEWIALEKGLI